jgi:hypothetical protein
VAQAKLTVAWPDGNEYVAARSTSGSGSGFESGGRSRSTHSLKAPERLSATRIAAPTRVHSHGRLQEKPEIAKAMPSQTNPNDPAYDSAAKSGSSSPSRWSTTQLWRS